MKIVLGGGAFYPYFDTGGVVYAFNVARWLVRFGHDVTVLCDKTSLYSNNTNPLLPDYEEVEGIKIIRSRKSYKYRATITSLPFLFDQYSWLKRVIKSNEVDIVNPFTQRCYPSFLAAARGRVPCVPTFHSILLRGGLLGFKGWQDYESGNLSAAVGCLTENMMLRLPYNGLIAVSDWLAEELSRYYPRKPIKAVYGGVDLEEIAEVASGPKNPTQVVFLGGLIKHKNILDAIEAVKLAREKIEGLEFTIMSSGGEYEEIVERLCQEDAAFTYYKRPSREQIFKTLKESSLHIYPSEETSMSLVVAEALACDTPFIAYDLPSIRRLLEHMPGGVLVPHKDYQALSETICELLNDRIRLEELRKQGKQAVEKEFVWEKTARKTEEAFDYFLNRFHGETRNKTKWNEISL